MRSIAVKLINHNVLREEQKEVLYTFFEFIVVSPAIPGENIE